MVQFFGHDENMQTIATQSPSLCSSHYKEWYRHTHPGARIDCRTCGKRLEHHHSKSRPIPEPLTIEAFLKENAELNGHIHPDDWVCLACYRSHLVIIKHINQSVQSTDSDLQTLISKLEKSIPDPNDYYFQCCYGVCH